MERSLTGAPFVYPTLLHGQNAAFSMTISDGGKP